MSDLSIFLEEYKTQVFKLILRYIFERNMTVDELEKEVNKILEDVYNLGYSEGTTDMIYRLDK